MVRSADDSIIAWPFFGLTEQQVGNLKLRAVGYPVAVDARMVAGEYPSI